MAAYQVGFLGTPAGRDDTLRSTLKSRLSEIGIDFDAVTVLAEADIASRNRKNPFVGIFFGYPAADDGAHPALPALIADSVVVVPCVDDLGRFTGHTPPALRHINGFELSPSDPGLEKLCALVLENFRLLRPERRLFISYRRNESQGIAIQLYERLDELGFKVTAADLDDDRFRYKGRIDFKNCDVTQRLPFPDASFDYLVFIEIIEHLRNPHFVVAELSRLLKPEGKLILSTPNILNLKSRVRYLTEGNYEFFREPPLDQMKNPKEKIYNLHIVPYRLHELEYLLDAGGFSVAQIYTSLIEGRAWSFLMPVIRLQQFLKEWRARKKPGLDYSRIHKV